MKRIITSALAAATLFMVSAKDFTVYNNGSLSGDLNVYGWWAAGMDFTAESPTSPDTKVYAFKADNGGAAASMGMTVNTNNKCYTGPFNSATLNFRWYATTPAKYTVRVTADGGAEQDYSWEVTQETAGSWQTMALPIATTFPTVSAQWKDFSGKGGGYIFSIIMDNGQPESVIYFDNIYYSNLDTTWEAPEVPEIVPPTTVPSIAQPKEDVLSVFSAYGTANFGIGSWGQPTQYSTVEIAGKTVAKLTNFTYIGWELTPALDASEYTHMHVDFYPCEETTFGFTPISPASPANLEKTWFAPSVKLNEWNSYDVKLSEFPIDLSNIFQIKFCEGKNIEGYLANVYFYKEEGGDEPPVVGPVTGSLYTGSTSGEVEQQDGETMKKYPYTLNYSVAYNEDKTLTVTGTYNFTDGEPFGVVPGNVFINNQINDFTQDGAKRTVTTAATYEAGESVEIRFYIPGGAGVILQDSFNYVVGTDNQAPTSVALTVADEAPVFYTLQGVRVENPEKGLFIRVQNGKATKVRL